MMVHEDTSKQNLHVIRKIIIFASEASKQGLICFCFGFF
ncbi:MAG: hypothetical protein KatS3mg033_1056 [Thermonema sp.]|nr:MAG: hypothetical protein KatS3mg033_1056 [Thermonema sp.]